jgi:HD-like signal output (HDOD) protein
MVKLVYSLKMTMLFDKISVLDPSMFWHHSLGAAIITQSLSRRIKSDMHMQDIAYLAGLMHDIGILVFGYLIPDDYSRFIESAVCAEESLEEQEKRHFGIDHYELGALFIEHWWNVDTNVIQAVRYHHAPDSGPGNNRLCNRTVHLANGICNNAGITNGIGACLSGYNENSWDELGLSLDDVEEILADVRTSLDQAAEILSQS